MIRKFTYLDHYREKATEFDFYNAPLKLIRVHVGKYWLSESSNLY
jgi:hypothetical protein